MNYSVKDILGVKVAFGLTVPNVLSIIKDDYLKDGKCHYICTTNPEFIMDAQKDSAFKEIINAADLSVPDGNGVLFAKAYLEHVSKFQKNIFLGFRSFIYGVWLGMSSMFRNAHLGDTISGVELTDRLCELSSMTNASIFLLGGWPRDNKGNFVKNPDYDFATLAAIKIKEKYPNVNIIGATSQFTYEEKYDEVTVNYIKECMSNKGVQRLDFLFVAYNHIKQEKWIVRNNFKVLANVSIGVGGTFDYITGIYKLAPAMYRNSRLEWLYKFIIQPWRYKRIMNAFPLFPLKVFFESLK